MTCSFSPLNSVPLRSVSRNGETIIVMLQRCAVSNACCPKLSEEATWISIKGQGAGGTFASMNRPPLTTVMTIHQCTSHTMTKWSCFWLWRSVPRKLNFNCFTTVFCYITQLHISNIVLDRWWRINNFEHDNSFMCLKIKCWIYLLVFKGQVTALDFWWHASCDNSWS